MAPTFADITYEFLSSVENVKHRTRGRVSSINFRLFNTNHSLSLSELAEIFDFNPNGDINPHEGFDANVLWTA